MGLELKGKTGIGMVAGLTAMVVACLGVTTTASSNAVALPDNQTALLTIQGQGVNPNAQISLSTGPKQTIVVKANDAGQFVFSNLKYASFSDLNFTIDIPPFEKGLVKNYPANHLQFRYDTKESMVSMSGKIGKSGTLAFNLGGSNAAIVQNAGSTGYVQLKTRTEQPMVGGQSALSASIINTAEVCCPQMILPSSPITLTILSQPVPVAPPVAQPPQNPVRIPAVNMPVTPENPQNAPAQNPVTPPVKTQDEPAKPVPYIILPNKNGEEAPQKPKVKVPYIVQGSIEVDLPVIKSDDIVAATSFSSSDYDATYVGGIKKMTNDILGAMWMNIGAMGGFLDARSFINTNRELQLSTVRTLRNYTPSDTICRFGTLSRSIVAASSNAEKNQLGFSKILLDRNTQKSGSVYHYPSTGAVGLIENFKDKYCDVKTNNRFLENYCGNTAAAADKLYNRDVDFTRVFDVPLTLDADFTEGTSSDDKSAVIALFHNLSFMSPLMSEDKGQWDPSKAMQTQDIRAISAMKSVSASSFGALVGQKAKSSAQSASYMNAMLVNLGLPSTEATKLIGANPSYFAQMEVLTKKLFQDPTFYANLYDSEANVDRQRVAMKAIELQQDRDFLESLRRREMLLSVLLNSKLKKAASKANEAGVVTNKR